MDRVPTGTVTLVFTDIEGSTQLLQALGPSYGSVLAEHHRILGDAFREQDGVEQGTAGDGLYFVFPTARGALLAAIAGQRRLAAHAWPDGSSVRVRMGIHTGEPTVGETGLVGLDVHRAARIGAVGHGGQVLVSQTTRDLAVGELDADIGFADLGEHQLKDLPGSQHLYQVVADGLAGRFADLRTVAAASGNLPRQLTTFVGRDAQLASGRALLTTSALVTLTGPGGVGKTRLAVRLASELADGYEDGAWLVELGALTEPALVATAVADTLGIMEQPGRPLASSIVDHLRGRSLLLVLDNCEHLLAACAELVHATLIAARGVRVLATSQEALGIAGEALIAVPSLTVPTVGPDAPAEDILACDAVQLFLERARAAAPGFELSPRNSAAIIQICRRLDGIPLAIELAAARLRALSVEQIAARLDDRFRLLTGGSRVAIPRHQTLRAAVDWSFELLSAEEAALVRRLSVFAGGFDLEAAETVGSGGVVETSEVLDLLARLVDKSLVAADFEGRVARYRMSEILRAYGYERLMQADEASDARRRHRDWCLSLADRAALALRGGPQAGTWLDRLDEEHDNLRSALEWSESQPGEQLAGLRLAVGLWQFWEIRGHADEGRRWLERMLAATTGESIALRANALTGAGILALMQGDYAASMAFHEQSLDLHRRMGDPGAVAYATNNMANAALQQGDYARANDLYRQSVVLAREVDDRHGLAFSLMNMADVLERSGDYAAARLQFDESIATFRALGDRWGEAFALDAFGLIAAREGDVETARAMATEAATISREIADERGVARALTNHGDLAGRSGDRLEAVRLYREAFVLRVGLQDRPGTAAALEKLAWATTDPNPQAAAQLLGAADAIRESIRTRVAPASRGDYERGRMALEERLGPEAFAAALKVGRAMSPIEAVATLPP